MHNVISSLISYKIGIKNIVSEDDFYNIIKEVKILDKFKSIFIVDYINAWMEPNKCLYIQMEFCEYNLDAIINMKNTFNMSLNDINYYISCELFREIVECVQYLHSRVPPIMHRDLKPANILITAKHTNKRYVKLCDFGIAVDHKTKTMYSTRGKSQTHTANVGTPVYMAPEVMRGRDYNRSADIYSLGMIALDMFKITVNE